MKNWSSLVGGCALLLSSSLLHGAKEIPEPLKIWKEWATWNDQSHNCPRPFNDGTEAVCMWPTRLSLAVERSGGRFDFSVTVFSESWAPLPGGVDAWPLEVKINGAASPVVEHEHAPAVKLAPGVYRISGVYRWNDYPQRLALPRAIGLLSLTIDGAPVEAPVWDAQGFLWLKRDGSTEETDKNFLETKVYAALEDGIPLWLRTEVELTVSGKSREEDLGGVLPEGWKLSAIESPIPVAIDDAGRMKAQVRAGKWTIHADAFRFDDPKEVRYAAGVKPAADEEIVAFRSRPDLRVVEITGAPVIDVSQTTFPEKWRELPVHRWDTTAAFQIEERMRGMGEQKAAGLTIARELWLDENGNALTFRDSISGQMQQIWRLDAAAGQGLGSVRSGGQGQLITRNPQTAAPGVEIRTRNLQLEATGRMTRTGELSATGWNADADAVNVTLHLPPGWRLFALLGADWVRGDWLTAWTLLDLFLLLIFTLAVFRLWGFGAALLAFVAFGLSFHEAGAPRYIWLILLVPLALQRVVPAGWGQRLLCVAKGLCIAILLLTLVPFLAAQVQQALYPQLEKVGAQSAHVESLVTDARAPTGGVINSSDSEVDVSSVQVPSSRSGGNWSGKASGNLSYDAKARIQTGPGVPDWEWRGVSFGWNGPVSAAQKVRPILISAVMERLLTALRVVFLLALAAVLLNARSLGGRIFRPKMSFAALLLCGWLTADASAQEQTQAQRPLPDAATINLLRERLLEPSDAFPHAAEIPLATLTLDGRRVVLDVEIHAAAHAAMPLPGRLPAWSPLSVLIDDQPEAALRRDDGYLWVVLPVGVHRVHLEALLANVTEWEWTFALKPRLVKINAPGWTFTGVKPDGTPEAQVFFNLAQKTAGGAATYDRQDLQTVAVIERQLELGLIWQVRTTVTRLSPVGKALALRVPLLPGENVFSSNAVVHDGAIEVRLGAQEQSFSWDSGLAISGQLRLATRADDAWVERWRLIASPVWNVALSGLAPIFEPGNPDLVPVWQPWPGESVELSLSRPEAIAGATMTVSKATHEITPGRRQRISKLDLSLRCSLGEDFLVELPANAEVSSLTHNGVEIPVRKDGSKVVIPVRPGEQSVSIGWKLNAPLRAGVTAEAVRLPVESANIYTIMHVPKDRWVLWTSGPQRGPAVRFWGLLICSVLAAVALGRTTQSPLRVIEWMLLVIGLTQVPLAAALAVIGWLFLLGARGRDAFQQIKPVSYNALQVLLIVLTAIALGILLLAVGEGLLGRPEMFIRGNGSSSTVLRWFQARSEGLLPQPACYSISIWWYRLAMLAWALWLAASLLRWLRWGWENFSRGGFFRRSPSIAPASRFAPPASTPPVTAPSATPPPPPPVSVPPPFPPEPHG